MRIAVLPNPRASGVREALPRVCAALRKLGAEVLLPGEGDAFPSPNADALIRESDVTVAFDEDAVLAVRPAGEPDAPIYLTVDGEEAVPLGPEEEVRLSRAESEACLIMLGRRPFYEVLNRKLMNR